MAFLESPRFPGKISFGATGGPQWQTDIAMLDSGVEYANQKGERIRAILDVVGDPRGAPAVVIPPAWGRTKETALPLAETLLATFRRAQKRIPSPNLLVRSWKRSSRSNCATVASLIGVVQRRFGNLPISR